MCNLIGLAVRHALTRRGFVAGSAAGASLIAPMMCSAIAGDGRLDTRIRLAQSSGDAANSWTRLLLLGTAGGPTWWPNSDQCGISSAVAVGDAYYLVDCGEGVGRRLQQAVSPASSRTVTGPSLRAVFLTHLHSDHTVDYPNLLLFGLFTGLDRAAPRPSRSLVRADEAKWRLSFHYAALLPRLFQLSIPIIPRRVPKI
ncbi:MBL fold metallo-hydrolase [Bradyrhizobium sp. USDA 4011]